MSEPSSTEHSDSNPVLGGTDVSADPAELEAETPATSDPEQMTDGGELGGVGGQGGAG